MRAFFKIFGSLPFLAKLIVLGAVGFVLNQAFQLIGPHLWTLAFLAWLIAGVALLRAAGQLQIADRLPILGSLLENLAPRRAAVPALGETRASERSPSSPSSPSVPPPSANPAPAVAVVLRETVRAEAERALGAMAGVGEPYRQLGTLANQAMLAQERGLSGFGSAASAVVLVLQGPSGTGKSAFARHAADLLYGTGALASRDVIELGRDAVSVYGVDAQGLQAKLEGALGGTLLLEDADWLVAEGESGGPSTGPSVTGPIVNFAQRHPGRLFIMCTASEKAGRLLSGDPGQRLWRAKVDLRTIDFTGFDDEALWSILQKLVGEKRLQIERSAAASAGKLLAGWRRTDGADFRNAHAVRELIDKADTALSQRVSASGNLAGREASTITVADIEAAARALGLPI